MILSNLKQKLLYIGLVLDNEWLDKYIELILDNLDTPIAKYETQKHHIIPRYYFKYNNIEIDNSNNNLVNLSVKDHILAHYFLCRCSTNLYKGYNYASINYILRNNAIKNFPDLEDFVKLLDNIDEYYNEYRAVIANSQRKSETKLKKSISAKNYFESVKNSDEWQLRNKKISEKLIGHEVSTITRDKLSKAAKNRYTNEINPFKGKHHTNEVKNFISKNNSKQVIVYDVNHKYITTLSSIKKTADYIKYNNLSSLDSGLYKKIRLASNTNTQLYGLYFEIIDNGHKK